MTFEEIKSRIAAQFPEAVVDNETLAEHQVEIIPKQWGKVAKFLFENSDLHFDQLECVTGVDLGPDQPFQVRYNLHSMSHRHKIEVVVTVQRRRPSVPSIEKIWRIGDWFEREVYDMFGIRFSGHRDLRRILCPEDWVGWPLRKDYQTPHEYHGIVVPKIKEEWV
jgi:NADH-quinone oxidoreductase subunit C